MLKILQSMHFSSLINYKLSPCCALFNFLTIFSLPSYSCGKIQLFFHVDNNSMWNVSMTHLSNSLVYQFSLFSFSSYRFLDCPSIFHIVSFLWSLFSEYQIHFPFSRSLLFLKTDYQHNQSGESVLSKEIW